MLSRILITTLFFYFFTWTNAQVSLIGKWRRVYSKTDFADTTNKHYRFIDPDTANKQLRFGDLVIRQDSTFHIEGDTSTQILLVAGWHSGDEYNGTWELRNSHLTLWSEPKKDKIFLPFIIIKLTKDKLLLRLTFDKKDITYLRI